MPYRSASFMSAPTLVYCAVIFQNPIVHSTSIAFFPFPCPFFFPAVAHAPKSHHASRLTSSNFFPFPAHTWICATELRVSHLQSTCLLRQEASLPMAPLQAITTRIYQKIPPKGRSISQRHRSGRAPLQDPGSRTAVKWCIRSIQCLKVCMTRTHHLLAHHMKPPK